MKSLLDLTENLTRTKKSLSLISILLKTKEGAREYTAWGRGGAPSVQSEGAFLKVSRDLSISDDVMLERESLDFAFSRYLP